MSGVSRQAGKAAAAAATARSTSGAPPRGTRAMTAPVAGLYTGPVCSGRTSTGAPSIQWDRMGSVASRPGRTSVVIGGASFGRCDRTRGSGWPAGTGRTDPCRATVPPIVGDPSPARKVRTATRGPAGRTCAGGARRGCGVRPDRRREPIPDAPAKPAPPPAVRGVRCSLTGRLTAGRARTRAEEVLEQVSMSATPRPTDDQRGDRPPLAGPHVLLVVRPGGHRPDRHRPRGGDLPLHARGPPDHRLQQPADVGEHRPRRPPGHRRDHGPGGEAAVRPAGLRHGDPGPPRREDGRDHAGRPRQGLLHARRRGGGRERDQARPPLHGPDQGPRPVPDLPRGDPRRDDPHRRPAPLGQRAGDLRRRALPGHPSLGREGAPAGGRGAGGPGGRHPLRGAAHDRGGLPRDDRRHERDPDPARRLPARASASCATATAS